MKIVDLLCLSIKADNVVANWWTVQQSQTSDCIGLYYRNVLDTVQWTVKDGSMVAGQWALFNYIGDWVDLRIVNDFESNYRNVLVEK